MQNIIATYMCISLALAGSLNTLWAQSADSNNTLLKPVQITGLRYSNLYTGVKLNTIDSTVMKQFANQSLADVLSSQSTIFVKTYGAGMLGTAGFRGGNAAQTAVLWHGFNLQSPMNGQSDLSLIPAYLLSSASVQFGSPAAMFGSGNISGAVHLNTENTKPKNFECMLGMGSFGSIQAGAKWNLQYHKVNISEKIILNSARNNYTYYNSDLLQPTALPFISGEKEHATHASLEGAAWLQEINYKANDRNKTSVSSWLQYNNRNIPPALHTSDVSAQQKDKTIRLLADHQYKFDSKETQVRYGWMHDELSYADAYTPAVRSTGNVHLLGADQFYYHTYFEFQAGIMAMIQDAHLSSESAHWQQNRQAIFGSAKSYLYRRKLIQQISLRQEWANGDILPLMPAYGIQYLAGPYMRISGNVARSYRLPTFNDLNWPQMGNPNLKPEEGWNEELSVHSNIPVKSWLLKTTLTIYNKNIHNWIIWLPGSNGLSSPVNMYKVRSRGVELEWNLTHRKRWLLEAQGMHEYCAAANIESAIPNDASLNQQLIYTPKLKHRLTLSASLKGYRFSWMFQYNGIRYTASDNSAWLNPYTLHNIYFSKTIIINNKQLMLQANLNNVFNADVQVMAGRPVPLRNFQITLIYTH